MHDSKTDVVKIALILPGGTNPPSLVHKNKLFLCFLRHLSSRAHLLARREHGSPLRVDGPAGGVVGHPDGEPLQHVRRVAALHRGGAPAGHVGLRAAALARVAVQDVVLLLRVLERQADRSHVLCSTSKCRINNYCTRFSFPNIREIETTL